MKQALWHINAQESALRPVKPSHLPNLIPIRSVFSLISRGTERTVCCGHCDKGFTEHMGVPYMDGSFDLPIKYGYSMIGEKEDARGIFYHFMHPHQSHCEVSAQSLTKIPKGMSPKRACLISNMETVINAIWDAKIEIGDKILIIGFGAIGSLLALALRDYPGVDLHIHDVNPWNQDQARQLGIQVWEKENNFDKVFHVTAHRSGLQHSIELCKEEGKVIELSWYGNQEITLSLGRSFHYGRKSIISSQVSKIPANKSQSWDYAKRKKLAIDLLMDDKYDALVSHLIPFSESPQFFNKLRKHEEGEGLNWLIDYNK